jgi:hypothetical protein
MIPHISSSFGGWGGSKLLSYGESEGEKSVVGSLSMRRKKGRRTTRLGAAAKMLSVASVLAFGWQAMNLVTADGQTNLIGSPSVQKRVGGF